jgi:hypothetical protein
MRAPTPRATRSSTRTWSRSGCSLAWYSRGGARRAECWRIIDMLSCRYAGSLYRACCLPGRIIGARGRFCHAVTPCVGNPQRYHDRATRSYVRSHRGRARGFGKEAAAFPKYIAWISAFLDWTDCPHHAGYRSLDRSSNISRRRTVLRLKRNVARHNSKSTYQRQPSSLCLSLASYSSCSFTHRFAGGRSASAKAPNGRRSSVCTLGPFRSAETHARPSRAYPSGSRREHPSSAP